jgi:sortase A
MLGLELIILVLAISRFWSVLFPVSSTSSQSPPASQSLTREDVLATPTPDFSLPPRRITFPGAQVTAPIIPAGRVGGTWETRHLGENVGHLVGTSWLGETGGNIVLAGHVESATGAPGPFAHLFEARIGDMIIVQDGDRQERFMVKQILRAEPEDIQFVAQDGRPRLTLITCTDWDFETQTYDGRLVVVADPVIQAAQQ